jgi:hypothetical protein
MPHLDELSKIKNLEKEPLHYVFDNNLVNTAGLMLEFGVFSGSTINFMAKKTTNTIYGFDSFEGLPESWGRTDMIFNKGAFNLKGKLPKVHQNVKLIKGWFNETLPKFLEEHTGPITFLHIDCDLYSSTKTIFDLVKGRLAPGCVIVFDELLNYPGWEIHEWKAWWEMVDETGIKYEWIGMNGIPIVDIKKDNGAWDQKVAVRII